MLGALLLLAAILLILYAFYKWATINNDYFARRNIKYQKPTFLVGNNGGTLLNKYTAAEFVQLIYQSFPKEPYVICLKLLTQTYLKYHIVFSGFLVSLIFDYQTM